MDPLRVVMTNETTEGHEFGKRHYYTCGGETLSWNPEWYTEPFFTSFRASYDSAASTGPINPPSDIITTVSACSAALSSSASDASASASVTGASGSSTSPGSSTTISPSPSTSIITSTVPVTITSSGSVFTSSVASVLTTALTSTATSTSSTSSLSTGSVSPTGAAQSDLNDPWSQTICAGGWDWQDWGVVGSMLVGVVGGILIWILWAILRSRMQGFYSARTWFVPPSSRPSGTLTFFTFFFPFLHLPALSSDNPVSDGQMSLHLLFAALRMAAIGSLVALAAGLPLYLVNTPCLASTSPANNLDGRLGTLTDLSLLRLLNSLDPSPDSSSMDNLLQIQPISQAVLTQRALSSTIAPAISNARIRLILVLVLMAVLLIGGGLWVVAKTYGALAKYQNRFEEEICGDQDMVWISGEDAKGWEGMGEEGVKEVLKKYGFAGSQEGISEQGNEGGKGKKEKGVVDVIGVFAVSFAFPKLAIKVEERKRVVLELEVAETKYVNSFKLMAGGRSLGSLGHGKDGMKPSQTGEVGRQKVDPPIGYIAPRSFYQIRDPHSGDNHETQTPGAGPSAPRLQITPPSRSATVEPSLSQVIEQRVVGSRFIEVNRDSALYGGKRFKIGQRVKMGEDGVLVAESSPESSPGTDEPSEESGGIAGVDPEAVDTALHDKDVQFKGRPGRSRSVRHSGGEPSATRPDQVALASEDTTPPTRSLSWKAPPRPKAHTRQPSYVIVPLQDESSKLDPSLAPGSGVSPSTLGNTYHLIGELRSKLKSLNAEIMEMQQATFEKMAFGEDIAGWIIVGKGVGFLPFSQVFYGRSKEDILWDCMVVRNGKGEDGQPILRGRRRREVRRSIVWFWTGVVVIGILLALLIVPVTALTVVSAPGFAHYLPFLKPLEESNGFGSGFTEGVVPAIILSLAVALAIFATNRLAKIVKVVSYNQQRMLAYKATFWLLFAVTIVWFILVASLEYSVQGFASGVQEARYVGDGSIFSTWAVLVMLINISVMVPALILLQPVRLFRYIQKRRKTSTPRQRFLLNYPPTYNPSYSLSGSLIAVFYATSLILFFPLLSIPIPVLLFLSLVANSYMIRYVCITSRGGPSDGSLGLWTIRRLGWTLSVQPVVFGLILLSRREWGLGAAGLAVGGIAVILVELFTVFRFPIKRRRNLSAKHRDALKRLEPILSVPSTPPPNSRRPSTSSLLPSSNRPSGQNRRRSNATILEMIHTLLPGVSRLPPKGPLPLKSEGIDCYDSPTIAAFAIPNAPENPSRPPSASRRSSGNTPTEALRALTGDWGDGDAARGLIYPPELLVMPPVIWLGDDPSGIARAEIHDLEIHHRLAGMVDPVDEMLRGRKGWIREGE